MFNACAGSSPVTRTKKSGYGAVGSALVWGARGREFKSRYSDQNEKKQSFNGCFFGYIMP